VAERDDHPIDLDLTTLGVLVLRGPGAIRAARAAAVTMLTQHGPASAEVITVGDILEHVPDFPGLRRAGEIADALTILETEAIHRTRRLDAEDINGFSSYRRQRPDDPLPALVLLTDHLPTTQTGRMQALAAQATKLGMGILLVDAQVEGAACIELDDNGTVTHAAPTAVADQLLGARMFSLSAAEAADLLATLARARADQPAPPLAPQPAEPFTPPEPALTTPPLRVHLLGPYRVETATGKRLGRGMRRKALELLAFYLLNPDGATQEQAVEALWPNAPLGREAQWFWNALAGLRRTIRDLCGDRDLQVIGRDGDRYQAETELFDVDLWRFESVLADAKQAARTGDQAAEAAALAAAAEAYGGQLLDGHAGSWVTIPREDLRRRAVNALARLAELREQAGDHSGALAALQQAITIDPVAEELYRRTMRLQARMGLVDDARHTYHTLERHLTELDLDPEPATQALAAELLIPHRRSSGQCRVRGSVSNSG
jgi:DNA-binding SARP family transcriptional activator